MIEMAVNGTRATGNPRVFIPIHWGLDNFMSKEQFDRFFWPTLRDLMRSPDQRGAQPLPPVGRELHHPAGDHQGHPGGQGLLRL